jgi:hypothetical protein
MKAILQNLNLPCFAYIYTYLAFPSYYLLLFQSRGIKPAGLNNATINLHNFIFYYPNCLRSLVGTKPIRKIHSYEIPDS